MRYRKKPAIVDAIQWTGDNIEDVVVFMHPEAPIYVGAFSDADGLICMDTLEGQTVATKGDWIIRGTAGELYPCKPDIFDDVYEAEGSDA